MKILVLVLSLLLLSSPPFVRSAYAAVYNDNSTQSATTVSAVPPPPTDLQVSGKWAWVQEAPYHGYFVIQQTGDSFSGTLDDTFEGTFGDRVKDGKIAGNSFSFTRDGKYGLQFWRGTVIERDGARVIEDGRWRRPGDITWSHFTARLVGPTAGSTGAIPGRTSAYSWTRTSPISSGSSEYQVTPPGADVRLTFQFKGSAAVTLRGLFTNGDILQRLTSWSSTPASAGTDMTVGWLRLLWWQALLEKSDPLIPDASASSVDPGDVAALRRAPVGLPTGALQHSLDTDAHWYEVALNQILSRSAGPDPAAQAIEASRDALSNLGQARDVIDSIASALQKAADYQGVLGNPTLQSLLQKRSNFVKSLSNRLVVMPGQAEDVFHFTASGKTIHLPLDKALIAFQVLSAIAQKLDESRDLANRLQVVLDYSQREHVPLDPHFVAEARVCIASEGNLEAAITDAVVETTLDWAKQSTLASLSQATPALLKVLARSLANAMAESAPQLAEVASSFSSGVALGLAQLSMAATIADVAFEVNGIYMGVKTALYSYNCYRQFQAVATAAVQSVKSDKPAAGCLEAWGNSIYLRELSIVNYHKAYADCLDGARMSKILANLVTHGGIDDTIEEHNGAATAGLNQMPSWLHPSDLDSLAQLYRSAGPADSAAAGGDSVRGIMDPLTKVHPVAGGWDVIANQAVHGRAFPISGLFHGAIGQVTFALGSNYDLLDTWIGCGMDTPDDEHHGVTFRVLGDGKELYRSPRMGVNDDAIHLRVPVKGCEAITLIAETPAYGGGAFWCEPQLVKLPPTVPALVSPGKN